MPKVLRTCKEVNT